MIDQVEERREVLFRIARWFERNGFFTRVNDGHRCLRALEVEGRHLHPQLEVWEGTQIVRFVEVETAATLDEEAPLRWKCFLGSTVRLHVYVPSPLLGLAWDLRNRFDASGALLLTYDLQSLNDLIAGWTPPERSHERA